MVGTWRVSASILVNGAELKEYGTEEKCAEKSASCYVPSQTGQAFKIRFKNDSTDRVIFAIHVDGVRVMGQILAPKFSHIVEGVNVTATTHRPFTFGKIRLTDHEDALHGGAVPSLGCIELKACRIKTGYDVPERVADRSVMLRNDALHERSKKSGTHRVVLGAVTSRSAISVVKPSYIDPPSKPYAQIKFVYRPADILQAQGIMPIPPKLVSPKKSPTKVPHKRQNEEPHAPVPHPVKRLPTSSPSLKRAVKREELERVDDLAEKEERLAALKAELERAQAEVDAARSGVGVRWDAVARWDVVAQWDVISKDTHRLLHTSERTFFSLFSTAIRQPHAWFSLSFVLSEWQRAVMSKRMVNAPHIIVAFKMRMACTSLLARLSLAPSLLDSHDPPTLTVRDMSVGIRTYRAKSKLEEYKVERPDLETATCYVASKAGEMFGVAISNNSNTHSISVRVCMDGVFVGSWICGPLESGTTNGITTASNDLLPFKFAELVLTDDDRFLPSDRSKWNNLGCIELEVFRVTTGSKVFASSSGTIPSDLSTEAIHERSKKDGTHRIILGYPEFRMGYDTWYTTSLVDPPERPYAKIKFVYKPYDILRAQGIIPSPTRTPTVARASHSRNGRSYQPYSRIGRRRTGLEDHIHSLLMGIRLQHAAQAESREAYLAALEEERRRVQAEIDAANPAPRIKREPSVISVPPPPPGERIVIDLTED
ncbi:hypothetical protein EIP91_010972 [Steccherinum ochraceum]|uniref:DUF7918 domain-containing protein n=1 Tax=Steccherinum ochraceum TaxID=92696 RepID=A0A4R0RYS2_9APHY|nr:hypothetical protein EIP91_010972 [Steccherinum ochraceum]